LLDKPRCRELVHELAIHLLVEIEIEGVKRLSVVAKACLCDPPREQTVLSTLQFVADERRQKVDMRLSCGRRALDSDLEHVSHAREAQLAQRTVNFDEVHDVSPLVMRHTRSRYSFKSRINGSIWRSVIGGVALRSRYAFTARYVLAPASSAICAARSTATAP
jgi:hypothetical protein